MNRGQKRATWQSALRTKSMGRPARVRFNIKELYLRGFSRAVCWRIADSLQAELAALTAQHGVPGSWIEARAIERASGLSIAVRPDAVPGMMGRALAQSVLSIRSGGLQ